MAAGATVVNLPKNVPLTEDQLRFFESVVSEFARSEWSEHQLELAAFLARNMDAMEKSQRRLADEGPVLINATGNHVQNPLLGYIRSVDCSILAYRRSLSLNASARPTDREDIASRREKAKKIESDLDSGHDDLLARRN
jgi:hypothetical protein